MTRGLQKGVTLNVASARCAFYGFCEVVFRKRIGQLVVDRKGALSLIAGAHGPDMSDGIRQKLEGARIYVLVGVVCLASFCLLFLRDWDVPPAFPSKFWNALAAFAILGIVSDSFAFRIPFAKVATSVGFIPFIASVVLFRHPWPMVVAGVTGVVVDTLVRHRPAVKVWFNTAQYMLATGLASLVYARLGGPISLEGFDFSLLPFACLVVTFFVVNQGSVALAVSLSSGVSVREAWDRIGKDAFATDF